MQIPTSKSAYRARLDGHYPRIETAMREAETMRELQLIWTMEQPVIADWPEHWQEHIADELMRCAEALNHGR
jgi:hypothetical protein